MEVVRNEKSTSYIYQNGILEVYDNGIIVGLENPDWDQPETPETVRNAAKIAQKIVGDNIHGMLYLPAGKTHYKRELVKAYFEVDIGHKAEAFVVESFGSRLLASLVVKFSNSDIPKKVFSNREEAEKWLLKEILKAKLQRGKK